MIKEVVQILPKDKASSLLNFGAKTLLLNVLDLVSVAYLIPIITLILSKEKFSELLAKYHIDEAWITNLDIALVLLASTIFFLIKNVIQIRLNKSLLDYLHSLKSSIATIRVENFIHNNYLIHKKKNKGELINVVMQATGHFCSKFLYSSIMLFSEIILLIILLIFSFYVHWQFMLMLLLIFGILGSSIYYAKKVGIDTINELFFGLHTKVSSILIDVIDGVLDIKSSKSETFFVSSFKKHNERLNEITSTLAATGFNYSRYFEIGLIICITFMGYYFFENSLDVLSISILAALGFKIIPSINKILNHLTQIRSHAYSVSILSNYSGKGHPPESIRHFTFDKEITLREASFGFDAKGCLFNKINFSIEPNDFVGIIGHTGAGKTTFLQLVMGLISPQAGELLIDAQMSDNHFLPFVSYVPQESYLFNRSVLENITMGGEDVDYKQLDYLCEKLQLSSVINSLSERYDTQVIHNDSFFSGGQKQRICIARALYNHPRLLILDEATNQQDHELEINIFKFIKELSKERNMAVMVVSHNIELSKFYDKTYEIRDQKLVLL